MVLNEREKVAGSHQVSVKELNENEPQLAQVCDLCQAMKSRNSVPFDEKIKIEIRKEVRGFLVDRSLSEA